MPKFTVTHKKTGKEEVFLLDQDSIVLGRLNTNDIELEGKSVSRKHAEIIKINDDFYLVDLQSGNGTFLNGRKLKIDEKTVLRSSDRIQIEDFEIKFALIDKSEPLSIEENTDSDIIEIKMIKKVLSALDVQQHPSLEVVSQPCEGRKVFFTENLQELVIGRDSTCQLIIDTTTVSRRHAVLHKKWGGVTISDLGSKNGITINNQKVEEKLLKDGDMIAMGTVKILYRNPQEINLEALSREYEKEDSLLKESKETKKEPPKPEKKEKVKEKVSEGAKISVSPEMKTKEKEEKPKEKKEPIPPKPTPPPQVAPKGFFSRFSTTEMVIMGIGGIVFLVALISLLSILL